MVFPEGFRVEVGAINVSKYMLFGVLHKLANKERDQYFPNTEYGPNKLVQYSFYYIMALENIC